MGFPAVLEREQLVQRKVFKMQQRDLFLGGGVRFFLIITAVKCLAKVRNLLFLLSEQPEKLQNVCHKQVPFHFFFFYLLKTIKNLFFRITLCEIKQPDNEIEIRENGMMGIILKILNSVKM